VRALLAGDWQVTRGVLKIARRIWEVGVAGWPVTGRRRGAFSTLLRRPGLRASTGGVRATQRERRMLASTCLYSLCAIIAPITTIFTNLINASVLNLIVLKGSGAKYVTFLFLAWKSSSN